MNPNDLSAVINGIAPALKEFVHDGLAPCEARLVGVEKRLDALPTIDAAAVASEAVNCALEGFAAAIMKRFGDA